MAPRSFGRRESLARRPSRLTPRPRILILCEGKCTEPEYFEDIRRHARSQLVDIEIDASSGTPKTLVERAAARKKASDRLARKRDDVTLLYDEVWCVFDVDEHPKLSEAKDQAQANGIHLAISNPCFELWLVLHFADQRAHIERHRLQRLCEEFMPGYGKSPPVAALRDRYDEAVQRARELLKWQFERGSATENPSTMVHQLTERIHELGRDRHLARIDGAQRASERARKPRSR